MPTAARQCWELYDLQTDPRELTNQYDNPEYSAIIADLKRRLRELRTKYNDTTDPLSAS